MLLPWTTLAGSRATLSLGDSNNIGIYATIHIPLIRLLDRLTGDYGLAYAWLVFPETFLQLLGFYILGRVLFKNRFWAFLLAFLTAMTVINIGLGEIWGVWRDALPRVTFQSLLPFLLALVLVWKDRPGRWPWLMIFAGLACLCPPDQCPGLGVCHLAQASGCCTLKAGTGSDASWSCWVWVSSS